MWIVRFALQRPYTFVIVAVLIAIFGISAILTTPTDILPDIDIPIVSVIWTYSGMDADDIVQADHCGVRAGAANHSK
jgi:multidrug efflux pump subunit AcrB